MEMETGLIVAFSFALIVLGFFKFNTWTSEEKQSEPFENPPRHFTTWLRFNIYALFYSSALVGLYVFCVYLPDIVAGMLHAFKLSPPGINLEELMQKNTPAISGVVFFMFLYAILLRYDSKWRGWVHEQAFIPDHAKALINNFKKDPVTFRPDIDEMNALLTADGILDESRKNQTLAHYRMLQDTKKTINMCPIVPAPETMTDQDIAILWAKVLYLKNRLERGLNKANAPNCFKKCKKRKAGLDVDYNHLRAMVTINFRLGTIKDDKQQTALNILKTEILDTAQKALNKLYLIDCCAVLRVTRSEKNQSDEFAKLGLTLPFIPSPGYAVPPHIVGSGLLAVFVIGLLSTFWFEHVAAKGASVLYLDFGHSSALFFLIPENSLNTVLWPFYSLFLHGFAVLIGISVMQFMHKRYNENGPNSGGYTVWSELAAVLATLVICLPSLMLIIFISVGALPFLVSLRLALPWVFIPITTTFFTVAYLSAVLKQQGESTWFQKTYRPVLQGMTTGFMSLMAVRIVMGFANKPAGTLPGDFLYFQAYAVLMPAAIGAILGYVLPSGYEKFLAEDTRSQKEAIRESATAEKLPAMVG